jgi:ribosomal protein L16 Arg81 hydroxylase
MSNLSDDHRFWIAENIIAGCSPDQLRPHLLRSEYSEQDIDAEFLAVEKHPYIRAARNTNAALKRRESLLKTLDNQLRHTQGYTELARHTTPPPYQTFLQEYYYPNKPVFFTNGVSHWAATHWTPENLLERVGADAMVEIQYGRDTNKNYEVDFQQHKHNIAFGDFIRLLDSQEGASNNFYMTANNNALDTPAFAELKKDIGNIADGYLRPAQRGETLLWIGPKGTITPLHHDLSNNLFVQLYGHKRITLIPSMQIPYLHNRFFVFSEVDLLNYDEEACPLFKNATTITVDVGPGDCLLIPIGWIHHVVGETKSISLTMTNFDAYNGYIDFSAGIKRY